jgi:hypothetical protein
MMDHEQQQVRHPSSPPDDRRDDDMNNAMSPSPHIPSSSASSSSSYLKFPKTFYRRRLPSSSISFSSTEGRDIFASAFSTGGTYALFPLIEQLQTQPEPAYCGLTTLVIILNGEFNVSSATGRQNERADVRKPNLIFSLIHHTQNEMQCKNCMP